MKKLRVYLDTCCLNRPFDDQTQERIRLEAEAVLAILSHIERGEWELVTGEVLLDEIDQIPDRQKRIRVSFLVSLAHSVIEIGEEEIARAEHLLKEGFHVYDALHIACAEKAGADIFLSTDEQLLKLSKRLVERLKIRVENPLVWIQEVV